MVLVSMTACQLAPSQGRTPPAPTAGVPAPTPPPSPVPRLLSGSFDAVSTTAMGITGDLALTPSTLTFSQGLAYETLPAASVQASAVFTKSGARWAELLAVDAATTIEVRAVAQERVEAHAPHGGLCRPDKTSFIALASSDANTSAATPTAGALKMAAFKSLVKPGAEASENDLCGTFMYAPR